MYCFSMINIFTYKLSYDFIKLYFKDVNLVKELFSEVKFKQLSLFRWNMLGCQGSLLSHWIKPIFMRSITIGSRYNMVVCALIIYDMD